MSPIEYLDPARAAGHPSARDLECLAFDPEAAHGGDPVGTHVDGCRCCLETVERLRAERRAFLIRRPAAAFVARILDVKPGRFRQWNRADFPASLLTAFGAAALALVVVTAFMLRGADEGVVHFKGAMVPRLGLLLSRGGSKAAPLDARMPLFEGDVLRFEVELPEQAYVFIASLDSQGRFSRYFPARGASSALLEGGQQVVPESIVLDDFVGEERVFLFTSPAPLEESALRQTLAEAYERAGRTLARMDATRPPASVAILIHKGRR